MLHLGPLAFAQPWILAALIGLPLLWWLLRVTPPSPKTIRFPAIRLLLGLTSQEETPARTPWWLILLRVAVITLIVLGLAQPLLNPSARLDGSGPLVLVVDDDWAAARHWEERRATLDRLLSQAERESRPVVLLSTAPSATGEPVSASGMLTAREARSLAQSLRPKPWAADRGAALAAVENLEINGSAQVFWLSNGLEDAQTAALARRLQGLGRLDVLRDGDNELPRLVLPPENDGIALLLRARRALAQGEEPLAMIASADDGRLISRAPMRFEAGETQATARLELPSELRNRVARLHIEGEQQAAAVLLLDERWRRRPVGLVSDGPVEDAQPLLSELYYLSRALEPFTSLQRGEIERLLERQLAVIVLADIGALPDPELGGLRDWVEQGGLLLRFAGPRLAEGGVDELMPVRLRGGGRILGGVLTWDSPARLAPFEAKSPFAGLPIPNDVVVRRQVLAEPSLELAERTWARLSDGTPLVTAEPRGQGWVVLVHTTANTDWSNLSLSGLFVEMLRRLVTLSQGVAAGGEDTPELPPIETLDGFGRLGAPAPTVLALDAAALDAGAVGPAHPPGYYGTDSARRAHNLAKPDLALTPIQSMPPGVRLGFYSGSGETDLKPWLLTAALLLALLDLIIALALRGFLARGARQGIAVVALLVLPPLLLGSAPALAQESGAGSTADRRALQATLETRLAFVKTGVPAVDDVSFSGLFGLTRVLQRRTSVEPGAPMGVELGRDELSFFPLLYWPVTPEQRSLDEAAQRQVNSYISNGGTILFDLRDPSAARQILGRTSRSSEALQRLTAGLEIPALNPVPPDHVLTKSFYLMQDFPGRYAGGTLWIGEAEDRNYDGVASVVIGANDWAAAWSIDDRGRPLFAVVPGGERQRELAFRVGVNMVMYALTGNYKADQVHVPFILERLGQ